MTISCTILYRNEDVILVATIACFMWRELTRVNGYFEVTIPEYLSWEFENHFRMISETCQLLTQEIMHTGRIPTDNLSVRPAILPDNKYCCSFGAPWQTRNPIVRSPTGRKETKPDISCEWNRGCTQNVFLNFRKLFPEFLSFHSVSDRKSRKSLVEWRAPLFKPLESILNLFGNTLRFEKPFFFSCRRIRLSTVDRGY